MYIYYGVDHEREFQFLRHFIWIQLTYSSSNWLSLFAIDFWCFQLSLLKAHDSLEVKWIGENFQNFFWKSFQLTFSLQLTLVNCTWSGPKSLINKQKYSAFSHKMDGQIWAVVFWRFVFGCVIFGFLKINSNSSILYHRRQKITHSK